MNIARNNIENLDKEKEKKKMNILKGNGEKVITFFIRLIGLATILPVIFIIGYIVVKGVPAISVNFSHPFLSSFG
jgi:ABC-type phosphate transport system permease subunit